MKERLGICLLGVAFIILAYFCGYARAVSQYTIEINKLLHAHAKTAEVIDKDYQLIKDLKKMGYKPLITWSK